MRSHTPSGIHPEAARLHVLSLMADIPESPFSIHNIALRGSIVDKPVGSWFGPNAAAQVIKYGFTHVLIARRSLMSEYTGEPGLTVHVAMDGTLGIRDVGGLSAS